MRAEKAGNAVQVKILSSFPEGQEGITDDGKSKSADEQRKTRDGSILREQRGSHQKHAGWRDGNLEPVFPCFYRMNRQVRRNQKSKQPQILHFHTSLPSPAFTIYPDDITCCHLLEKIIFLASFPRPCFSGHRFPDAAFPGIKPSGTIPGCSLS
jgi:hypothetical protein